MALPTWLRHLLLCTLVLVLPLQGLAASTMALCTGLAPALPQQVAPADPAPDCHGGGAASSVPDHRCGLCTLGALVGALPDAAPAVPVVRVNLPPAAAPAAKVARIAGSRLDRPPRARA